jgi:hypothetical protein
MASEYDKGEVETEVFSRFLELSGLPIDPSSVEKRLPPEPGILCRHETKGTVAFELVEMCDSNLARFIAQASGGYLRTSDPSVIVISKKLQYSYETTAPIELLCHVGRIISPDNLILPTIAPYFDSYRHVFRKVWLLGRKDLYVVWEQG